MLYKCCPKCGKIINHNLTYCDSCNIKEQKLKRKRYKEYKSKRMQDNKEKQFQQFYNSSAWNKLRECVLVKYFYLDIYSYYMQGTLEHGYTLHHIEPIRNCWDKRLDINNLIYLTESNHQLIHELLNTDYKSTVDMLQNLVSRWNKEFKNIKGSD